MATDLLDTLRLHLAKGVGPVLSARLIDHFGAPADVLRASAASLERVHGIGPARSKAIRSAITDAQGLAEREIEHAERLGARIVTRDCDDYPTLLRQVPGAPLVLYVRGTLATPEAPLYAVSIVGSRSCTAYGVEQAERFAAALAERGVTIVSGGARGIDTAAHRAAVRVGGRTIAVLGSGLASPYPPENAPLFDQIVEAGGAVISELPMPTTPAPENFPGRNRIISGLSLGVIVIEAPHGSGALITAKHAAEEHGREVMAVPGRIDSPASTGSNELIRQGAALVAAPDDVIEIVEPQARHLFQGTHADRFAPASTAPAPSTDAPKATSATSPTAPPPAPPRPGVALGLTPRQVDLLAALEDHPTFDELITGLALAPEAIRADVTTLEIKGLARREGSRLVPVRA